MAKTGRPSEYSEDAVDEICAYIAEGNSLRKTCVDLGYTTTQIYNWLGKKDERGEYFRDQYARAKEDSGDADQDKLDEIAEKVIAGELDPQAARVAADIIKWSASKKKPKKYGDRIQQDISGSLETSQLSDDQLNAKIAAYLSKEANK